MIKKLKLMILSMSSALMLLAPVAVVAPAYAATPQATTDIQSNLCKGSDLNLDNNAATACQSNSNITGAGSTATNLIKEIINILSIIVGAIAVLMIIFAGFRYVTSGGNAEGTKSARQTIIYAIVGLVIVALAQIIVHFVLNGVSTASS